MTIFARINPMASIVPCVMVATLWALVMTSCAPAPPSYKYVQLSPDHDYVVSHKYRMLVLVEPNHEFPLEIVESETCMISPRFSPDGDWIAFYDTGTSRLPVSSTDMALGIVRVEDDGSEVLSIPLPMFDIDRRLMVDDVVPPIWEPNGETLLIPSAYGIDRVNMHGELDLLVDIENIRLLRMSPVGGQFAFSDGQMIFVFDYNSQQVRQLLGADFVPPFGNLRILALTYSADGRRLGFSMGGKVFELDIETGEVTKIFESSSGAIYWLAWLPGEETMVCLSGYERRPSGMGFSFAEDQGKYKLDLITKKGELVQRLFSQSLIDVRQAVPDLSPDGRFVLITIPAKYGKEVLIVATDGSGVEQVSDNGPNSFAAWRAQPVDAHQ